MKNYSLAIAYFYNSFIYIHIENKEIIGTVCNESSDKNPKENHILTDAFETMVRNRMVQV